MLHLLLWYAHLDPCVPSLPRLAPPQLRTHAKRIWMPWRQREALFERLHFATVPVSRVPGALPGVLREWTYGQRCAGCLDTFSLAWCRLLAWMGSAQFLRDLAP